MSGPLANAKHEEFCQLRVIGKMTQDEAYAAAAYKPDRGAASRLSAKVNIRGHIKELRDTIFDRYEATNDRIIRYRTGQHQVSGKKVMVITYNASRPNYAPPRFEPKPSASLICDIRMFLDQHPSMGEGKFGTLSCNSYYIVQRIERGASLMPKTERAIRDFMRRYRA